MSKSVVLVLKSSYQQDYGEHANVPVYNSNGEIVGWTGGEVPEYGHPCEFNVLNDEGFTACASSTTVSRLRREDAKLRELVYDMLVDEERGHNDDSTFYEHVERANELGIEVSV